MLLESKFLHEFFKIYHSTNYITYCIITFIVVKTIIGQVIFYLGNYYYKYNNLLNITLVFINTVNLVSNIYHRWLITKKLIIIYNNSWN